MKNKLALHYLAEGLFNKGKLYRILPEYSEFNPDVFDLLWNTSELLRTLVFTDDATSLLGLIKE